MASYGIDGSVDEEADETEVLESLSADLFGTFRVDVRELAIYYLDKFFEDKEWHAGGRIPKRYLYSDRYISMALNTGIMEGVDKAYEALEKCEIDNVDSRLPGDIRLVVNILDKLAAAGVPRPFAAGFLLIYLELCIGIELDE